MSVVRTHFGFGENVEQKEVKCKHCGKTVSVVKGNGNNLFNHDHVTKYEECKAQKKRDTNKHPSASTKQHICKYHIMQRFQKDGKK